MNNNEPDDFILDDIGVAAKFAEFSGRDFAVSEATILHSITLYEFNVGAGILRIQDMDVVTLKMDVPLRGGEEATLKRIRRDIRNFSGCVYTGKGELDYVELIKNRDIPESLEVISEDKGKNTSLLMKVKSDFTFEKNRTYALYLQYDVELKGEGQYLFYSGAIQPSDYIGVRRIVNIEEAEKVIWICIWSKRNESFSTWCFNASAPCLYPPEKTAEWDDQKKIYKFDSLFVERIMHWDRAMYFSVFSNVKR